LKIAVNTRLLVKNKLEGIGWFSYETLKRITTQHPEHEFYFIFDRKHSEDFIFSDNITPIELFPQARHPFLYYLWFEFSIPKLLKKLQPDLFLSPDGYTSLKSKFKSLVVFHDLNFEHYPEDIPLLERKYYKYFFPKYAKKADRIATVSEYSKQDIVEQYKVSPDKIDVVFNGANENFVPLSKSEKIKIKKEFSNGASYFVYVGSLHPRKNLVNLIKAYDKFKTENSSSVKLLIVGEKMWNTSEIDEVYNKMKFKDEVIFIGRLNVDKLHKVLASALALTYVSYFEGFGIPIVEAFRCDVPVITSNVTSMPEIAGDAALHVDPFSINSIADALKKIDKNEELRNDLIEKGRQRRNDFTWQKSAENLWRAIEKTIKI